MHIMAIEMPDGRDGYLVAETCQWHEMDDTVAAASEWVRLNDGRWHEVSDED